MGMTIDEANLYMELYKRQLFNSVSNLDKDIEAYNIAIDTMRKYQKIEEIVTQWQNETDPKIKFARSNMEKIKEVIEDGNDR